MEQENDYALRVLRKLNYFYVNKIPVHFTNGYGTFFNGTILNLNEKEKSMILDERMLGETPFLFEDINEDSITKQRAVEDMPKSRKTIQ